MGVGELGVKEVTRVYRVTRVTRMAVVTMVTQVKGMMGRADFALLKFPYGQAVFFVG